MGKPTKTANIILAILLAACASAGAIQFAIQPNEPSEKKANTAGQADMDDAEKVETSKVEGENCFSLFRADAEGHCWENAYLLALACHYNYHEKLEVEPFECPTERFRQMRLLQQDDVLTGTESGQGFRPVPIAALVDIPAQQSKA